VVGGAVKVTVLPEGYVSVKLVFSVLGWSLSAEETTIGTPLEGLVEFTVSV
jgi:hypothetical protein